ncbi:insulinase family protein [Wolbachia endosymbiont of Litomosoides sigmodontis]|uniref:M16 family metallopeptidase n=1 Tax=Wolbachia endosymbiont of Litomosoides sigmodontis TaxID=80850 RepID=UPI001588431F|nr:pitrilysin family protein [Wolbachia endosymbiont of Litomosoides sigmodontis]QKX03148.1 insulinase family protein [Wolbachia endosymbiont of Litomosoides sigmodontis]
MNMPRVTKLDNGLRIITEQVLDVDSVALNIRIGVGSRAESVNQNGISHFLEHMAFKGTKTRTAFEIAQAFDDIGGVFNASTGRESTNYYVKVLKKDIKIGIGILIDILMNSTFPEDELEREKGVVIQEILQTNDSPSDIIFDKYFEVAYKDQPFSRSILGTQDTVRSFARGDLNNYINEHYFGENMIFAVAGDIEHEEVAQLTKDFFSKISSQKFKENQAANCTGGEYLEYRKLDQVYLLIGFPSVSRHDNRYYTFQVLDSILGSGMSSRLFQEVREKQGLAYSVYSFNSSYTDTGMLSIFAGTDSNSLDKLLKSITTELKKLSTDDLREEEVNRVKERIKSQILMSRESVSSRAKALGHYYGNYNRYISKNELIEKTNAVTTADVKKAAEELLFKHEKTTLAAIGEIKSLPSYDKVISMLRA